MTELMDAVLNGIEGDETAPISDETTIGDRSILEDNEVSKDGLNDAGLPAINPGEELEDTTDSVSSQPGANLTIATDDEKELLEGDDGRQDINDEDSQSKQDIERDEANENGDDSNMDIDIKVEDLYGVELEDQLSTASNEECDLPLVIDTSTEDKKSSWKLLQNGVETNTNEENSSSSSSGDTKPLLSGLLARKEDGSTSKKPSMPQSRSFSVSDGNVIAKELEEQVAKLEQLLVLKEKEWSSILRLKKHMEYALEQVRCTQKMAKVEDGINGPMSTTEIKACMNLIVSEKDAFNLAERQIEESIESTETENESLQTIFPFRSSSITTAGGMDDEVGPKGEVLTATAALQKLCRKRKAGMDELLPNRTTRAKIADTQSNFGASGQGRQVRRFGNIVSAQSIIDTHRNLGGDKPKATLKPYKRPAFNMDPNREYAKTIAELISYANTDQVQKDVPTTLSTPAAAPSVPQITSTRTLALSKSKNGKPAGRQATINSNSLLISNATPSGSGTLAKMLSPSTHSTGIGSTRTINDASNNASQKFSNKLPTSDANLSLANLLASSKVESKVNMTKIKKERRDEEASHVPSQQQADQVPICQGCNLSRAQFVCAGCANQWYCSRECQVAAWDEHSEICSG